MILLGWSSDPPPVSDHAPTFTITMGVVIPGFLLSHYWKLRLSRGQGASCNIRDSVPLMSPALQLLLPSVQMQSTLHLPQSGSQDRSCMTPDMHIPNWPATICLQARDTRPLGPCQRSQHPHTPSTFCSGSSVVELRKRSAFQSSSSSWTIGLAIWHGNGFV